MTENSFQVVEAKREAAPLTIAIISQSGGGKTYTALLIARGLVGAKGKIVVIDTEGKRALIYADDKDIGGFYHVNFELPYSSLRYREAVKKSVFADADAIIIDSASHEHEAEGGMIDYAEQEEIRLKNRRDKSRAKWIKPKTEHNRFVRFAVGCPAHVIFCIREKVVADMSEEAKKKKAEDKVLYLPVCEKNLIFEMTLSIRLEPVTHVAEFIKVPKPFEHLVSSGRKLTIEDGVKLLSVASTGKELDKEYQKQLTICKDVAAMGTDTLKEHWATLSKEMKEKLKDELDTVFKPIALKADQDSNFLTQEIEEE